MYIHKDECYSDKYDPKTRVCTTGIHINAGESSAHIGRTVSARTIVGKHNMRHD